MNLLAYYIVLFLVILVIACKISYAAGKAEAEEKAKNENGGGEE